MTFKYCWLLAVFSLVTPLQALELITDEDLESVTGQDGVSLSGELSFNDDGGGPLTDTIDPDGGGSMTSTWGSCSDAQASRCGARLAVKLNKDVGSQGWYALDEMTGKISFEGLTIKSREITSSDTFGGDENNIGTGMTVLEIGLPNKIKYENFSYNVVTSSTARPTDAGFTQQVRHGIDFNGSVNMQGNMLVFPTGNP